MENKLLYRNLTVEESNDWRNGGLDNHIPPFFAWKASKADDANAVILTYIENGSAFDTPMDLYMANTSGIVVAYYTQCGMERMKFFNEENELDAIKFYNTIVDAFKNSNAI